MEKQKRSIKTILLMLSAMLLLSIFTAGCGKSQNVEEFNSLEDLKGKKIAVLTGSYLNELTPQFVENPELYYTNTSAESALMLANGQVDAYAEDEPIIRCLMLEHPDQKILATLTNDHYGAMFNKGDAFSASVRQDYDAYLSEISENGVMEEIDNIWFGTDESLQVVDFTGLDQGEKGIIHVGTTSTVKPFSYIKDGNLGGYEIDILTRFAREYGYGLDITDYAPAALINALSSGKEDMVIGCLTITDERKQTFDFSSPDYEGGTAIVVNDPNAVKASTNIFKSISTSFQKTFIQESRWKMFLTGIRNTLLITILSLVFGTLLGFFIYMLCRTGNKIACGITKVFTWLIHGLPAVVLMMILFYIIFGKTGASGVVVATIGFTLTFATAMIGMLQMGVGAVDPGQFEAAYTLGFSSNKTFMKIILPQAAQHFMPSYQTEIISLIKATAIVGYIAVQDLTKIGDIIRGATFEAYFPLIAVAVIYFILETILVAIAKKVTYNLNPKNRDRSTILKGVNTNEN